MIAATALLSFFFLARFFIFCLNMGGIRSGLIGVIVQYQLVIEAILLICVSLLFIIAISRMSVAVGLRIVLILMIIFIAWIIYGLPFATTYGMYTESGEFVPGRLYVPHYEYYELGFSVSLFLLAIFLQLQRSKAINS